MSLHTSVGESGRLLSPLDPDPVTIINGDSTFQFCLFASMQGRRCRRRLVTWG